MRTKQALLSLSTTLLLALVTSAHATEIVVVSARGTVTFIQGDHAVPVSNSSRLTLPAQIKTGADGAVDLKDSESQIHIGPNSTVALPDGGPSGSLVDRYLQSAGTALYNIQARHGRPMSVETPYLVSVVKGTVFTIAVEEGASNVTLMEGSLDVSSPGTSQHVLLKPNQSIRHAPGDKSLVVVPVGAPAEGPRNGSAQLTPSGRDDGSTAQMALVTRDLAEVGATVAAQRVLTAATVMHPGSPQTPAPPASHAGGPPSTGTPGTVAVPPPATAVNTPPPAPPVDTPPVTNPSGPPTPPATGSGATPPPVTSGNLPPTNTGDAGSGTMAGNPTPGGSTSGGGSSGQGSNGQGSDGSGSSGNGSNGSDDSNSGSSVTYGCNGKSNGTGHGQCRGHRKP